MQCEQHALDKLTEDCWKEVLSRVEDPKDLWSCSETCQTFQDILRRKRNGFMFSLVLPQIQEYLSEPRPEAYAQIIAGEMDFQTKSWNALMKCRLVCKSWRKSVNELLEAKGLIEHLYRFNSGQRIQSFLEKFSNYKGNPFLNGRSVTVLHRSPLLLAGNYEEALNAHGEQEAFYIRMLRQLLERFGKEIWSLNMVEQTQVHGHVNDESVSLSKNLLTILGHLPNLRSLNVRFGTFFGNEYNGEFGEESKAELTSYIAANPLPDLPLLEGLYLGRFLNAVLKNSFIVKYATQLKHLSAGDPSGFPEQFSRMRNLETLIFTKLDASTSLTALRQLPIDSPLRRLSLTIHSNRHSMNVWPMDKLFQNIAHLRIQWLDIVDLYGNVFLGESRRISPERRPNSSITSLELVFCRGTVSFNFLLYCQQLSSIFLYDYPESVRVLPGHPNGVPELLDVAALLEEDERDFSQSDIWDNLQNLEDLKLRNPDEVDGPVDLDHYVRDENGDAVRV